ncbi:CAAX amino protease family protein [Clostridium putrefaciens]|uniref:CAAX amino protease family protein n=1 Tax=Clostridium putrefaciens TaxID=99675 RepID=A0A381J6Q7_9CLOT|nr:type II CAAX endopeptidase family protein [Clostridium putrefaciens]SUY46974.1 CAAX amino protease family protein [Clostridium putrefaciens]
MKKYLRTIRNITFFGGLYFIVQIICSIIFGITYGITHRNTEFKKLMEDTQKATIDSVYILTLIAALITFVIYILVLRNKQQNLWQRCNFKKIDLSNMWKIVIIAISVSAFSSSIVYLMADKFESYNKVNNSIASAYGSILSMLCILILIPIFEEILFRGLIFNELKKTSNIYLAIILQAVIFAIFHGNMLQGIYTFLLGVILSLIYIWTNSLLGNILCHIIYNLCGVILIPIALYYTSSFVYVYMIKVLLVTIVLLLCARHGRNLMGESP